MRGSQPEGRLVKARALVKRVTRAAYVEVPAGVGVAGDDGDVPAQRDYFCLVEVDGTERCVATLTAVELKVLCLIPHAGSGMCARCEYIDAAGDGQAEADDLLRRLLVGPASIVPMDPRRHKACRDPAPHLCPECQQRPRLDSERPMERPS